MQKLRKRNFIRIQLFCKLKTTKSIVKIKLKIRLERKNVFLTTFLDVIRIFSKHYGVKFKNDKVSKYLKKKFKLKCKYNKTFSFLTTHFYESKFLVK